MSFGWSGQILRVDLSKKESTTEDTEPYTRSFIGGRGINVKILYDETAPETSPFDPISPLIFGAGVLGGTPVPSSRVEVTAKSPETGFLGTSNLGGFFGPELKFAGYDNIVLTGKADNPVYLFIYNDNVEIRDASHLWGKDTEQTTESLHKLYGSKIGTMVIVPPILRIATLDPGLILLFFLICEGIVIMPRLFTITMLFDDIIIIINAFIFNSNALNLHFLD